MIRDLPDKAVVPGSGAYKCSMDHYHSQGICPGPSISSTGLRTIQGQSPWHFWSRSPLNPDRYEEPEESPALTLGKAAHALILGDEVFADHFIFVPDDAPRRPTKTQTDAFEKNGYWSEAAEEGAVFWEQFDKQAKGRLLLTAEQMVTIKRIADNLSRSPEALQALTGGMTEISMIWQDELTGVWLKARPDVIPDNGFDFGDLKTFAPRAKSIERAVHQAITDHQYPMQMALAVMGAEAVFGTTAKECVLIMCQTSTPYTVTPVRIEPETLYLAKVLCRQAINTFAECLRSGHWPMPVEGILNYSMPESMAAQIVDLEASGQIGPMEA